MFLCKRVLILARCIGFILLICVQLFGHPFSVLATSANEKDTLIFLHYNNKGFAYEKDGVVKGPMVQYVNHIAKLAGIQIRWVKSIHPYTQIFSQRTNYCSYAMVKTPDRENMIHFTETVGEVHKFSVISRRNDLNFNNAKTFADLIKQPDLIIGVIKNNSYGPYIDKLLKNQAHQVMQSMTLKRLFYMTHNGKIDYFLVTKNNTSEILKSPPFNNSLKSITDLKDLNELRTEFSIACSINTDVSFIKRLNTAIQKTPRVRLH